MTTSEPGTGLGDAGCGDVPTRPAVTHQQTLPDQRGQVSQGAGWTRQAHRLGELAKARGDARITHALDDQVEGDAPPGGLHGHAVDELFVDDGLLVADPRPTQDVDAPVHQLHLDGTALELPCGEHDALHPTRGLTTSALPAHQLAASVRSS